MRESTSRLFSLRGFLGSHRVWVSVFWEEVQTGRDDRLLGGWRRYYASEGSGSFTSQRHAGPGWQSAT